MVMGLFTGNVEARRTEAALALEDRPLSVEALDRTKHVLTRLLLDLPQDYQYKHVPTLYRAVTEILGDAVNGTNVFDRMVATGGRAPEKTEPFIHPDKQQVAPPLTLRALKTRLDGVLGLIENAAVKVSMPGTEESTRALPVLVGSRARITQSLVSSYEAALGVMKQTYGAEAHTGVPAR